MLDASIYTVYSIYMTIVNQISSATREALANTDKPIRLALSEHDHQRLREAAAKSGMSMAAYVKQVVVKAIGKGK